MPQEEFVYQPGKVGLILADSDERICRLAALYAQDHSSVELCAAVGSARDLLELVEQLSTKGVAFVSQKEAIDTTTPTGKFMLTVFGAVAELEREYILQRQREGIEIAKAQGKYKGRKPISAPDFDKVVAQWRRGELTAVQAMKKLGMSKSSFYRHLRPSSRPSPQ